MKANRALGGQWRRSGPIVRASDSTLVSKSAHEPPMTRGSNVEAPMEGPASRSSPIAPTTDSGGLAHYATQQKLAAATEISVRTWERMRADGTGPRFAKAGRKVLYRWQDVEDWLAKRRFTSTAEAKRETAR
jgi:hypothetical protein